MLICTVVRSVCFEVFMEDAAVQDAKNVFFNIISWPKRHTSTVS